MNAKQALTRRLELLETHLRAEHPNLLPVIPTFRAFDRVLYRMHLLDAADSLATRIPWWPMIAVLGLFSAGKSSFINTYLGVPLQATGNQAVDDKFTVICYGPDRRYDSLPGAALNQDPRFPFFRISDEIEKVAGGEGKRIDSYLQLKTSSGARLRGKTIIDSPGFDADDQRRSTLRITDHIIDLADLVLVLFDARRPEPGSMHDTLEHLVSKTIVRTDASKFLYILNQLDSSAREDNPEEIVGAWQRAIAQAGLISGKFYGIYNLAVAPAIDDPAKRARYEAKCVEDITEIYARIDEVEFGRGYRIIGILDSLAKEIEGEVVPYLQTIRRRWRRNVLLVEAGLLALIAAAGAVVIHGTGFSDFPMVWEWLNEFKPEWAEGCPVRLAGAGLLLAGALLWAHFATRRAVARRMARHLPDRFGQLALNVRSAFLSGTRAYFGLFRTRPVGWGKRALNDIFAIREAIGRHVQRWNDLYTDPAGVRIAPQGSAADVKAANGG